MDIQPKAPEISIDEITVVLVGDFNPKIFHPMWFAHNKVLRDSEAEEAVIEVIHADVASFSTEWLTVQVLRDRFTAAVKADVYRDHLGDLVQNTFTLLSHSPVHQMGVNATFRLHFRTEEDWHSLGHLLAPKSPWNGVLDSPGLRTLAMRGKRNDDRPGHINVTIDPDLRARGDALVRINDHYEAPDLGRERKHGEGATWALDVLKDKFGPSLELSAKLVDHLVAKFLATTSVDAGT